VAFLNDTPHEAAMAVAQRIFEAVTENPVRLGEGTPLTVDVAVSSGAALPVGGRPLGRMIDEARSASRESGSRRNDHRVPVRMDS